MTKADRKAKLQEAGLSDRDYGELLGAGLQGFLAAHAGSGERLAVARIAADQAVVYADGVVDFLVGQEKKATERAASDKAVAEARSKQGVPA